MVMTKGHLRKTLMRRLKQQEEDERRRGSDTIRRKVFRLAAFRQATSVCCYVALPYEVQTLRMIEGMLVSNKRVVVPIAQVGTKRLLLSELRNPHTELAPGAHGVLEPLPKHRRAVSMDELDLVLVPGLAFDRKGHRLGHGHGYFDRFLARLPDSVPTVGLAFRFQLFDHLPVAAHDHPVQRVLSA